MNTTDNQLKFRLQNLRERISNACRVADRAKESVRLIAVTKNHPAETLQSLIDLGVRDLGENRVQEIEAKVPQLTGDFTMHMIGHLQTNKAKKVWSLANWIQSVDREKLVLHLNNIGCGSSALKNINYPDYEAQSPYTINTIDNKASAQIKINTIGNKASAQIKKDTIGNKASAQIKKDILVEVNTSGEASKSGCAPDECERLCELVMQSPVLSLRGLMTIGPLCGDEKKVRGAFAMLRELSQKCCVGACGIAAPELSMGMSGDFEWAIAEGATMVRVGTTLVGER